MTTGPFLCILAMMWDRLNTFRQRFWLTKKEKADRLEFLDKLQGLNEVYIKKDLSIGVAFIVTDNGTGHVDNYFLMGPNEWISWGTTPKPGNDLTEIYTTRELEIHLTNLQRRATTKEKITILDESCCVVFDTQPNYEKIKIQ